MSLVAGLVSNCFKGLLARRSNASHDVASHAIQSRQTDGQDANWSTAARSVTSMQDHSDAKWGCFEALLLLFRAPKLPVEEKLGSPVLNGGSKVEQSDENTVPQQNLETQDVTHNPMPSEGDHGFAARQDTAEQQSQLAPFEVQMIAPSQVETEMQQVATRVVDIQPDVMGGTGSVETMDDSHDPLAGQDEAVSYIQPTPILEEDNLGHNEALPDTQHPIHSGETLDRVRQPRKKSSHLESSTNGTRQPRKKRDVEKDPPPSEPSTVISQQQPRKKPEMQSNDDHPSTSREPGTNVAGGTTG